MSGSSPLARGFPARPALPRRRPPDHPRSRGVYALADEAEYQWGGSSPLARGLRHGHDQILRPEGIIPARAGFTLRKASDGSVGRDHPRSRGVYRARRQHRPRGRGSSPLARGLLWVIVAVWRAIRIIPARAGFTVRMSLSVMMGPDHPRSRGVYLAHDGWVPASWGSSPLARGLLERDPGRPERGRIIPARAGFTATAENTDPSSPDHPRSRGVYGNSTGLRSSSDGSSPLARGLPDETRKGITMTRIIPARAGFTPPTSG